jgi:1,4-dihydroxy-2-naphthoate octaprenyltransferase
MLRGALRLARPVPLMTWSATTVVLGAAAAAAYKPGWPLAVGAVAVGGGLLQGYVTHGLNDLYDWQSGTDQTTPGTLSGGSHAVRDGLLTQADLRWLAGVGAGLYVALLVWVGVWRTTALWPLGGVALAAAVLYSLPPARFCYRPWAGEWLGIFPPIAAGVLAAGIAIGGQLGATLVATAVIQGILCVASVMEHHMVDIESDWAAIPQKRTSPAYWQKTVRRRGCEIAALYDAAGALMAGAAALVIGPRFWWSAVVSMVSAGVAYRTRVGDVEDEIHRDWWLKGLAVVHAAGYAALAVLGVA